MSTVASPSQLPTASNPALAASLVGKPGFDRVTKKTLGQEDFLKLLATQMANQDPTSPSNDLNSISQMASFSSAQGMSDLVTSMKSFMSNQNFAGAQTMLGKYVTVQTGKDAATGAVQSISGTVTTAGFDDAGSPIITVGGNTYSPTKVIGIQLNEPATTTSTGG